MYKIPACLTCDTDVRTTTSFRGQPKQQKSATSFTQLPFGTINNVHKILDNYEMIFKFTHISLFQKKKPLLQTLEFNPFFFRKSPHL